MADITHLPKGAIIGVRFAIQTPHTPLVAYPLYEHPGVVVDVNLVFRDVNGFNEMTNYWAGNGIGVDVFVLRNDFRGTIKESGRVDIPPEGINAWSFSEMRKSWGTQTYRLQ